MKKQFIVPFWGLLITALCHDASAGSGEPVDFNSQVKPILSDRCYACHGPDGKKRQADLRLDLEAVAKREVIVPGKPSESELYLRITHPKLEERMPPAESKLSLSKEEIDLIRRWIEQGAPWDEHWSFVTPEKPPLPGVDDERWSRNEIDRFVLARLEHAGLRPAPAASRQRLLRRLSFDLTGLPPTLGEIDAFLADTSPDAYEATVDRLLWSPRYGERMAADWLDTARYSDTYGYQVDRDRFVWPWRDWVVRAFNDNMAYDEFITCQLAGDLLPKASDDQVLATTFNRLHPQKVEGGSVPEEFRAEYVADRIETFSTAFLGLTLGCARCHDHKYDPFSQKEFYQLGAFFNSIDEAGLYSYFTKAVPTPTLLLVSDSKKAELRDLKKRIAELEGELPVVAAAELGDFQEWLRRSAGRAAEGPLLPGRIAHIDFEDFKAGANKSVAGRIGKAVQLTGDDGIELEVGNFRRYEPFSVALWMKTPDEKKRAVVFHRSRAWTDAASRGYELLIEEGCLSAALIHFWPGNAIRVRTRDKLPLKEWLHVAVVYDGSSRADGLRIYVGGKVADCEVVRDNLYKNITGGGGDTIAVGERFRDRGFTNGSVDEFFVFERALTDIEIRQLHDGESLELALRAPAAKLSDAERRHLRDYYLATIDGPYRAKLQALQEARQEYMRTCDALDEIMVMRELPQPRPTFLLERGAYDRPGERVGRETPASLPAFSAEAPRNRLGLARWLTDRRHPLTARVAANRFWQLCFGHGLVRTPEDFGSQGRPPTHPQLLDWLAVDFMEQGWDVKRLLKKIVMSATYRQRSAVTPGLLARDPENLLLARAPSYRLPAEMLRDNALAVSGLLVDTIGGPPAKPYEVEVSFKPVDRDKGAGLYRRSLYTYWKRTGPAPVMMTLDASKRDVCRVRRERTTSPLQAFVLLNSPQFVEAARVLAARLVGKPVNDVGPMIEEMFRILISRRPEEAERQILIDLYRGQLAYFEEDSERARHFLETGDAPCDPQLPRSQLAATAVVVNTLMNFDECVMKR